MHWILVYKYIILYYDILYIVHEYIILYNSSNHIDTKCIYFEKYILLCLYLIYKNYSSYCLRL